MRQRNLKGAQAAIQQELATEDSTRATNMATALISGQMAAGQGSSGQPGQSGNAQHSGQWQNGGSGTGQGGNMLVQALASASGQTTDQINQAMTSGNQTVAQIAQQLASAGTITETSLAAALQQEMAANEATRASTAAQDLINGQMPGRQVGSASGSATGAGATTSSGIVLTIGSPSMSVNGVAQDIDGNQTQPVIRNSRTFVPIAAIITALGGTTSWDNVNQTVTINLNNTSITLAIGSTSANVNGVATPLDDAPFISSTGRTMLPLAFITKSLGHTASWNAQARTITIQ